MIPEGQGRRVTPPPKVPPLPYLRSSCAPAPDRAPSTVGAVRPSTDASVLVFEGGDVAVVPRVFPAGEHIEPDPLPAAVRAGAPVLVRRRPHRNPGLRFSRFGK